jgi:hypothetical protein
MRSQLKLAKRLFTVSRPSQIASQGSSLPSRISSLQLPARPTSLHISSRRQAHMDRARVRHHSRLSCIAATGTGSEAWEALDACSWRRNGNEGRRRPKKLLTVCNRAAAFTATGRRGCLRRPGRAELSDWRANLRCNSRLLDGAACLLHSLLAKQVTILVTVCWACASTLGKKCNVRVQLSSQTGRACPKPLSLCRFRDLGQGALRGGFEGGRLRRPRARNAVEVSGDAVNFRFATASTLSGLGPLWAGFRAVVRSSTRKRTDCRCCKLCS